MEGECASVSPYNGVLVSTGGSQLSGGIPGYGAYSAAAVAPYRYSGGSFGQGGSSSDNNGNAIVAGGGTTFSSILAQSIA